MQLRNLLFLQRCKGRNSQGNTAPHISPPFLSRTLKHILRYFPWPMDSSVSSRSSLLWINQDHICRVGKEIPDTWNKTRQGIENLLEKWDQGERTYFCRPNAAVSTMCINSLDPYCTPWGRYYYFLSLITNEVTEKQRGQVPFPSHPASKRLRPSLNPWLSSSAALLPPTVLVESGDNSILLLQSDLVILVYLPSQPGLPSTLTALPLILHIRELRLWKVK